VSDVQFPRRVGPYRVVAFTHITAGPGTHPVQGIAITKDGERFNVHSVWLTCSEIGRWEGQNGRYGITWPRALGEMVQRALDAPAP
jgi:hypothetical protein